MRMGTPGFYKDSVAGDLDVMRSSNLEFTLKSATSQPG